MPTKVSGCFNSYSLSDWHRNYTFLIFIALLFEDFPWRHTYNSCVNSLFLKNIPCFINKLYFRACCHKYNVGSFFFAVLQYICAFKRFFSCSVKQRKVLSGKDYTRRACFSWKSSIPCSSGLSWIARSYNRIVRHTYQRRKVLDRLMSRSVFTDAYAVMCKYAYYRKSHKCGHSQTCLHVVAKYKETCYIRAKSAMEIHSVCYNSHGKFSYAEVHIRTCSVFGRIIFSVLHNTLVWRR